MSNRLQDKVAVVTGAASGIGAACARRLAAEGASVVVSDLSEATCAGIVKELRDTGAAFVVAAGDVTARADTEAVAEAARASFGGLDVLVNSAGISARTVADEPDLEERWRRVIDVNLKGTMLMCMAAVEVMRATRSGSIVNIASIMGHVGYPLGVGLSDGFSPYAQSKGGVVQLTRDLGAALGREGIRVNAVCPGSSGLRSRRCSPPTTRRIRSSSTSTRSAGSPSPRRSRTRSCSSPPTTRRS